MDGIDQRIQLPDTPDWRDVAWTHMGKLIEEAAFLAGAQAELDATLGAGRFRIVYDTEPIPVLEVADV